MAESTRFHLKLTTPRSLISRVRSRPHAMVIFPVASKIIGLSSANAPNLARTYRKNFAIYFSIRKHQADCSLQSLLNPRRNAWRPLLATAWTADRWVMSSPSARRSFLLCDCHWEKCVVVLFGVTKYKFADLEF